MAIIWPSGESHLHIDMMLRLSNHGERARHIYRMFCQALAVNGALIANTSHTCFDVQSRLMAIISSSGEHKMHIDTIVNTANHEDHMPLCRTCKTHQQDVRTGPCGDRCPHYIQTVHQHDVRRGPCGNWVPSGELKHIVYEVRLPVLQQIQSTFYNREADLSSSRSQVLQTPGSHGSYCTANRPARGRTQFA